MLPDSGGMGTFNLSVSEFRTRHSIADPPTAETLLPLLNAVEYSIVRYLGYDPIQSTRTEYFDGDGTDRLSVGSHVTTITTVHENYQGYYQSANFTADELLTVGEDYALEIVNGRTSGVLRRIGRLWPYSRTRKYDRLASEKTECYGCIKIVYIAGLTPTAMDLIREAAYAEANALYRTWPNSFGAVMSDSIDGASVSITPFPPLQKDRMGLLSPVAKRILNSLRRPVIA